MRNITKYFAFFALLATVAAGCSDSADPYDDDDDDDVSRGTMQGTLAHSGNLGMITFVATTVLPSQNSQSVSILAVDGSNRRFTFTVNSKATGTYTIGIGTGHQAQLEIGNQIWVGLAGSSGTITINSLTSTTMSGTVSIVLPAAGGTSATGTMTIALTFSGTFGQT